MREGGREEGSQEENEKEERRRPREVEQNTFTSHYAHLTPPPTTPPQPTPPPIATEVADLNITSTRLASQLIPLHQKVSNLSAKLAQLQCEVGGKREEKERREKQRKTEAQTELLKLKRELDVSNNNPFSPT